VIARRRGAFAVSVALVLPVLPVLLAGCGSQVKPGSAAHAGATTPASPTPPTPTPTPPTPTAPWPTTPSPTAFPSTGSPASPTPTALPVAAALRCATAAVDAMPATLRAGQLLMAGVPIADPSSGASLVRADLLGGVFLVGRTVTTPSAVATQLGVLQRAAREATGVPLLVAADQEGGKIQALRGTGFGTMASALQQGALDETALRAKARQWAAGLAVAGVNLDLAPVADTVPAGFARRNPPIGALDRQFGSSPERVAGHVAAFVAGARESGVLTTVKHFPGLGRVTKNTDFSPSVVDSQTTVDDPDLRPFAAGIRAGAGAVMVSSAIYRKIDPDRQAVFSRAVIEGLLRRRLGYDGVVMTDDVGSAVAVRSVAPGQRAVLFVRSGGDLVLTVDPTQAAAMRSALIAEASTSPSFARRVTQSATRIVALKAAAGLLPCGA